MSEAVDRGITVTEIAAVDQPIEACPETTAAFVGRALRGPLNTPVLVHHFGDFRRRFGDVWARSSLGPAVKQFFDHGGKNLYVVRVANNARGALLCVPAEGSALVLRAVEPGSTERLRAAVDYDGIEETDAEHFNLTVQRLDPATGLLVDQEIFTRVSFLENAENFVADRLQSSDMVRVEMPFPKHRPEATTGFSSRYDLRWLEPVQPGTDGGELTAYDLIGSFERGSGMFALEQVEHFDLLYLPATGRDIDAGPAAILAAEMYCRRRGSMLVVDPAPQWQTVRQVVQGMRDRGYASPNLVSYFPRLVDRAATGAAAVGENAVRAAGGALAGLLCKLDRNYGPWHGLEAGGLRFQSSLVPEVELDEDEAHNLSRAGVNAVLRGPAGRTRVAGSVTMARGSEPHRVFKSLSVRRLCLRVVNTIDLATRWAVFEKPDRRLTARIRGQVLAYLATLYDLGALETDRFLVQCDAGLTNRRDRLEHGVTILLVFHPLGSNQPVSFTLHQTVAGCRVATTAFAPIAEHCA